jgi:hypothetical protein
LLSRFVRPNASIRRIAGKFETTYGVAAVQAHVSRTHDSLQQSLPSVQVAPTRAQVELPLLHRGGVPAQVPAQHSSFVVQEAPTSMQAEVQTDSPPSPGTQVPSQQVSPLAQGAPRGRHGPGPNSHRPLVGSHPTQHGGTALVAHDSPVALQSAAASRHTPSGVAHSPEQQSPFVVHGLPAIAQSVAPHVPALHPSEQQSEASVHCAPSTRQYGAHSFERDPSTGSHRPLQQ